MSRTLLVAALALLAAARTTPLAAQRQAPASARVRASPATGEGTLPDGLDGEPLGRSWQRPLASLLVPGSGQLMSRQSRGLIYLAVEAWLVARAIAYDRRGDDEARQYRDLAYDVARSQFAAVRRDGPFEYYETMEKFVESGAYDGDAGSAFVPESDPVTYNGSVWLLARRTYFVDPDSTPPPSSPAYLAAEAFYRRNAVTEEFRWSWRNARLEQDVFRQQIRASDQAFQGRTNALGLLVLNHVASAVDALITLRAGRRPPAIPQVGFPGPDAAWCSVGWQVAF